MTKTYESTEKLYGKILKNTIESRCFVYKCCFTAAIANFDNFFQTSAVEQRIQQTPLT